MDPDPSVHTSSRLNCVALFVLLKISASPILAVARPLAHTSSIWKIMDESSSLLSCALISARRRQVSGEGSTHVQAIHIAGPLRRRISSGQLDWIPRVHARPPDLAYSEKLEETSVTEERVGRMWPRPHAHRPILRRAGDGAVFDRDNGCGGRADMGHRACRCRLARASALVFSVQVKAGSRRE
jgi:hypothetical protein